MDPFEKMVDIAKKPVAEVLETMRSELEQAAREIADENMAQAEAAKRRLAKYFYLALILLFAPMVILLILGMTGMDVNGSIFVIVAIPMAISLLVFFPIAFSVKGEVVRHLQLADMEMLLPQLAETTRMTALNRVMQDHWFCPYCADANPNSSRQCRNCAQERDDILVRQYADTIMKTCNRMPPTINAIRGVPTSDIQITRTRRKQ